jgi:hypothetical protein
MCDGQVHALAVHCQPPLPHFAGPGLTLRIHLGNTPVHGELKLNASPASDSGDIFGT